MTTSDERRREVLALLLKQPYGLTVRQTATELGVGEQAAQQALWSAMHALASSPIVVKRERADANRYRYWLAVR